MCSVGNGWHSADTFDAGYAPLPSEISRGLLPPTQPRQMMLIQLVTFQRSMYCVTAVIQALRTALLYPLDDPNPKHLKRTGLS